MVFDARKLGAVPADESAGKDQGLTVSPGFDARKMGAVPVEEQHQGGGIIDAALDKAAKFVGGGLKHSPGVVGQVAGELLSGTNDNQEDPGYRTWGEAAQDTGVAVAKGGVEFARGANEISRYTPAGRIQGLMLGDNEPDAQDTLERDYLAPASEYWQDSKSAGLQEQERLVHDADGFLGTMGAAVDNPGVIMSVVSEQALPTMLQMGLSAKAAQGLISAAGAKAASGTATAFEGVQAGGAAGVDVRGFMQQVPIEALRENPEFEALEQEHGEAGAREVMADRLAPVAASIAGASTMLISKYLGDGSRIAGLVVGDGQKGVMAGARRVGGEILSEGIQEPAEGAATDFAKSMVDDSINPLDLSERGSDAALGMMAGGGQAAGIEIGRAGLSRYRQGLAPDGGPDPEQVPDISEQLDTLNDTETAQAEPVEPERQLTSLDDILRAHGVEPAKAPEWAPQQNEAAVQPRRKTLLDSLKEQYGRSSQGQESSSSQEYRGPAQIMQERGLSLGGTNEPEAAQPAGTVQRLVEENRARRQEQARRESEVAPYSDVLEQLQRENGSRKKDGVDVERDDILTAISKLGGLDPDQLGGEVDVATMRKMSRVGRPVVRGKGQGLTMDHMAESLSQEGFTAPDGGPLDPNTLAEALDNASRGESTYAAASNRDGMVDPDGEIARRWFSGDDAKVANALRKYIDGKPLTANQQGAVDDITDYLRGNDGSIYRERDVAAAQGMDPLSGELPKWYGEIGDMEPADMVSLAEDAADSSIAGAVDAGDMEWDEAFEHGQSRALLDVGEYSNPGQGTSLEGVDTLIADHMLKAARAGASNADIAAVIDRANGSRMAAVGGLIALEQGMDPADSEPLSAIDWRYERMMGAEPAGENDGQTPPVSTYQDSADGSGSSEERGLSLDRPGPEGRSVEAEPEPEASSPPVTEPTNKSTEAPADAGVSGSGGQEMSVDEAVRHRIKVAQQEIESDIANGTIPADVSSFSGLHDHVDANEYVNDAEREDRVFGPAGKRAGFGAQEFTEHTGRMIDALDAWLVDGRKGNAVDHLDAKTNEPALWKKDGKKVWRGDNGMIITDESMTVGGNRIKSFFVYANANERDRGNNFASAESYAEAKRKAEAGESLELEQQTEEQLAKQDKVKKAAAKQAENDDAQAEQRRKADNEAKDFRLSGSDRQADVAAAGGQNDMFGAAASEADPAPTEAQKEAGNYKKGHIRFQGLDIAIENARGSKRSGTAPDGTQWESEMAHHYGYIKRTEGADGDHVDVFIGPEHDSARVYVIDQLDEDGNFDEHKVMLGFRNQKTARDAYRANYQEGWNVGPTTSMSMGEFKSWLANDDTTKPLKAEDGVNPKQDALLAERFGVPADTEFQPGPASFNRDKFRAVSGDVASGYRETKEAAAKELAEKIAIKEAHERQGQADERIRARIAEKIKAGEKPSSAEWESMLPSGHVARGYVRQSDIGWFLVDYLGVPKNRIKASIGKASGTTRSDMGAEYPIVYLGRLHEVLSAAGQEKDTAPEHSAQHDDLEGVSPEELTQMVQAFAEAGQITADEEVTKVFAAPKKSEIVRLNDKTKVYHKDHGWMTPDEAKKVVAEWKENARKQGIENRSQNADKVVLSFFDYTGSWSKPWEEAGYQVWRFDIQTDPEVGDINNFSTDFFNDWFGGFDGNDVYAILAACPCTDFASSGARHFAAKDADGRTIKSIRLVRKSLAAIEYFKPAVWALENPVGRIEKLGGLPPWRLSFDPNHLGEDYTKKTLIWGRFNADLPIAPTEPTEGSKMHRKYGGKSIATKNARSETPEGFSYGFFQANNAVDNPVLAIGNKYDQLDPKVVKQAVDAGMTEQDISEVVDDYYYQDMDFDAANADLREAAKGWEKEEPETVAQSRPIESVGAYGDDSLDLRRAQDKMQSIERELTADDIARMPLSKIWPKKEVDALEDKAMAAFATIFRGMIPNKPRQRYRLQKWVAEVQLARDMMQAYMDRGPVVMARLAENPKLKSVRDRIQILGELDRADWGRVDGASLHPDAYTFDDKGDKVPQPFGMVNVDGRRITVKGAKTVADLMDPIREALGESKPATDSKMKFTIRGRKGFYFIHKEGDPEYRHLKTFTDLSAARDFVRNDHDKLVAEWEAVKKRDNVRKSDVRQKSNRERIGADHRNGRDISVEEFHDTFGLRHVDWGNWVSDKNGERQGHLNRAYDAFMDLASITGIPPKAIGLNGDLIITFGKRGSGNASAHFEPGQQVINLTKTNGAGSLAHEWFHALDNYFQRSRTNATAPNTREASFVTYSPETHYVHKTRGNRLPAEQFEKALRGDKTAGIYVQNPDDWVKVEGIRPEVETALAKLVEALDSSPMRERARTIDQGKSDGYWSRIIERAARSFENYVIAKMQESGEHNDYLANVTTIEKFHRNPERYPYLLDSEIAPVKEAFDNLFRTIKAKETDSGTALYSVADAKPEGVARRSRSILGDDNLLAAWTALATDDDAFQLPVSDAKTIEGVFDDTQWGDTTLRVRRFPVMDKDGTKVWIIDQMEQDGSRTLQPNGRARTATFYDDGKRVWLDVSEWGEGGGGSHLYSRLANYAHNTGKVFIGDPVGLSDIGMARRLENMISSALKFGTTDHLAPHDRQIQGSNGVPPLNWEPGNFAHNLREMLKASMAAAERQFPEIRDLQYNPDKDAFENVNTGEVWDERDFDRLARQIRITAAAEGAAADSEGNGRMGGKPGRARVGGPVTTGRKTLERAVVGLTILRSESESGSGKGRIGRRILARFGSIGSKRLTGPDNAVLYSNTTKARPSAGLSASGLKKALGRALGKQLADSIDVVQSNAELPTGTVPLSSLGDRIEGMYHPESGKVYLVADGVASEERAAWVAWHELWHRGIRSIDGTPGKMPGSVEGNALNQAINRAGLNKSVKDLADAIMRDRGMTASQRRVAVEEALAELNAADETGDYSAIERRYGVKVPAGMRSGIRGHIQRFVDAVRGVLAKLLNRSPEQVSDAEAWQILTGAREGYSGGPDGGGNGTSRFLFAGERADSRDTESLTRAKKMAAKGVSAESIRRDTGWHRGPDGRWRFEIADDKAKLLMQPAENVARVPLSMVLDHPQLFAAYPALRDADVVVYELDEGTRGAMVSRKRIGMQPMIEMDSGLSQEEFLSTLLHEIQHAIQEKEGFAFGGNMDASFIANVKYGLDSIANATKRNLSKWREANRVLIEDAEQAAEVVQHALMFESAKRLVDYAQHESPSRVFRHIRNEMEWIYHARGDEAANDLQRRFYAIPKRHKKHERNAYLAEMAMDAQFWIRQQIPADRWDQFENDPRTLKGMINAFRRQASKARDALSPMRDLERETNSAETVKKALDLASPYQVYRALAGEVESRNVQRRQHMTEKQRVEVSPESTADVRAEHSIVLTPDMEMSAPESFHNEGRQVASPAFRRWFGDSKVVDENGKPKVVYHGTDGDFDTFSEEFYGEATGVGDLGEGFYFTDRPDIASDFAGQSSPSVMPVYLDIKNPATNDAMQSDEVLSAIDDDMGFVETREVLESLGYDGVIYDHGEQGGVEYVAFRPEQIKSVNNRGTFDPDSPNVLFSVAEDGHPETEAGGRQRKFLKGILSQPLDRMFRLPFDALGMIDARGRLKGGVSIDNAARNILTSWKPNPEGRFGWMDGILESARAGLLDRYGLSAEYKQRWREAESEIRQRLGEASDLFSTTLAGMSTSEAKVLQSILTGELIAEGDWAQVSEPVRRAIDEMGQEAVRLGLITAESYNRNKGKYLHRSYLKHEAQFTGLSRFANNLSNKARRRIQGDSLKARGIEAKVSMQDIKRSVPAEWWQTKMEEGKADPSLTGSQFILLEKLAPIGEGVDTLASIEEGGPRKRKVLDRHYWPADKPLPAKYEAWENRGVWEVRGTRGDNLVLWRDYTKAERARMGEIVDARYNIVKTFETLSHDLAMGRFFSDVAKNTAWFQRNEPAGGPDGEPVIVDANEAGRLATFAGVDWVKVPETSVGGAEGAKKWGSMAGGYVRAEIWRDLNELDKMHASGTWRSILNQWKLNKTVRSPVVHMNNVMSNLMFMDLADVRVADLVAGIHAYVTDSDEYKDALVHGAFEANFAKQELNRKILQPILDELVAQNLRDNDPKSSLAALSKLGYGIARQLKRFDNALVSAYEIEDEVFRMATFLRRRAMGDNAQEAAAAAREQFLDYDIRAPWVNAARRTVLPFISYTYRAVPVVAQSILHRPWKLAKYYTIAYMANILAYSLAPGDEDEERRTMQESQQGYTWLGVPRMARMPWRDEHGNPVFLDVRRWVPAGDVFDTNVGNTAVPVPSPLQWGGPLMLGAELALNKVAFTGKPITDPQTDTGGDMAGKVASWAWKSWMPSAAYIPGSWYWDKTWKAVEGGRDIMGRPYSVSQALASSVGVKVQPHDVQMGYAFRSFDLKDGERTLRYQARRLAGDKQRGLISSEVFKREMQHIEEKMRRIEQKARELQGMD